MYMLLQAIQIVQMLRLKDIFVKIEWWKWSSVSNAQANPSQIRSMVHQNTDGEEHTR